MKSVSPILLLIVALISGCGATIENNWRSRNLSVAYVPGVLLPNHGPGGINSYSIISEEAVPISIDQTHLLTVSLIVPGLFAMPGRYEYAAAMKITDVSPKDAGLIISSVATARPHPHRLVDYYAITVPRGMVGAEIKLRVAYRVDIGQQPVSNARKEFSGAETLRIKVMDEGFAKERSEKWNRDVRFFEPLPSHWVAQDLGEIAIEPGGMIIADGAQGFRKLKEEAARRGATALTDLKVIFRDAQTVGGIALQEGYRARAVVLRTDVTQ